VFFVCFPDRLKFLTTIAYHDNITRIARELSVRGGFGSGHDRGHGNMGCKHSTSCNINDVNEWATKANTFEQKTKLEDAIIDIGTVTRRTLMGIIITSSSC